MHAAAYERMTELAYAYFLVLALCTPRLVAQVSGVVVQRVDGSTGRHSLGRLQCCDGEALCAGFVRHVVSFPITTSYSAHVFLQFCALIGRPTQAVDIVDDSLLNQRL